MSKKGRPVTFRPETETRKWLEKAQQAGFDMSAVVNDILSSQPYDPRSTTLVEERVKELIQEKAKQLSHLLDPQPSPFD